MLLINHITIYKNITPIVGFKRYQVNQCSFSSLLVRPFPFSLCSSPFLFNRITKPYTTIKRHMYKTTRTGVTLTTKLNYNYVPRQNFPGKFKIVDYNTSEKPVTGSGKPVKNHETYHKNLQETTTGKIYGGFTSNPKPGQNNYHYISNERLDGKTTGQWLGLYNNPKVITKPQIVKDNPQLQAYADANEATFEAIIQSKKKSVCEERTSKNDSKFFNENGTKDYDFFQGKD